MLLLNPVIATLSGDPGGNDPTNLDALLKRQSDNSIQAREAAKWQALADTSTQAREHASFQTPQSTGIPKNIQTIIEYTSNISLKDVRVHYNSDKATSVGKAILNEYPNLYVAPGQEEQLSSELWAIVLQLKKEQQNPPENNTNTEQSPDFNTDTVSKKGESGDPIYDAINWSAIPKGEPFQIKKGKTSIYGIIRSRGWAKAYGPSVTAHIIQHLRNRYRKSIPHKMTDALNFKEGAWITVPNFEGYHTYMAQRAKADDPTIKPFYEQYLAQATPQEQDKEQKKTDTNPKKKASDKTALSGNVGGYTKGDHVGTLHVAWTIDDGPTSKTDDMETAMDNDRATWYVVRSNMGTGKKLEASLAALKRKQDAGGEIAIHSPHPTIDHMDWFPARKTEKDYEREKGLPYNKRSSGHYGYDNTKDKNGEVTRGMEHAMNDLRVFKTILMNAGIHPKFVRMPGGLHSELMEYAKKLKFSDLNAVSRAVITGKSYDQKRFGGSPQAYEEMKKDFNILKTSLNKLQLLTWGGSGQEFDIGVQSWQAISHHKKSAPQHNAPKELKKKIKEVASTGQDKSLVILTHDTRDSYVQLADETKANAEMEAAKTSNKVLIKYHTMSSLFKQITKKDANEITVRYETDKNKKE